MQHDLFWVLASASVAVLAGAAAFRWLYRRRAEPALPESWALTSRPVFRDGERQAYRSLREALPQHVVLAKLSLVRLCQPTEPHRRHYWYRMLGASHVTFAICSAHGRVLAAVDIASQRDGSRDLLIKQAVLKACGVRYLRCPPDGLPPLAELQQLVPGANLTADTAASSVWATQRQVQVQVQNVTADAPKRRGTTVWQDSVPTRDPFVAVDNSDSSGGFSHSSGFDAWRRHLGVDKPAHLAHGRPPGAGDAAPAASVRH